MAPYIGLIRYADRIDQIGGESKDIPFQIKRYAKKGALQVDIYLLKEEIMPAGIKMIKKGIITEHD